ncbi:Y-family DNA polymerase [Maritalea mediterranea]|uniref:DNA polymerase Y family protein n=1 Tax=Maritalea mediterranea TaxID=2909667 RepID=A0ABS9E2Q7_9HYPH|nr:DNA polymerase Y family protein [Maritalea mediterranea]MCF4097150.1 DNA polymerase Y family protein [Maritalea mediterranea]
MKPRRILCIWFPNLPIEHLRIAWRQDRAHPSLESAQAANKTEKPSTGKKPFALIEQQATGLYIAAANEVARQMGVHPAMRLTDAKALCHELEALFHNPAADRALLHQRAAWLKSFSPIVVPHAANTIFLDITGCDHLFGGELKMLAQIDASLKAMGHKVRLGLGDTIGAAWAVAHFAPKALTILPPQQPQEGLAPLPVEALRLHQNHVQALFHLGLKTIGQLFDVPRAALYQRFSDQQHGEAVLKRLEQALGLQEEPLTHKGAQPDFRFTVAPLDPLIDLPGIAQQFDHLLDQLFHILQKRQQGVVRLSLTLFYSEGKVKELTIGLAQPTRSKPHIQRLFDEKLTDIDPGFGIDILVLSAHKVVDLAPSQLQLDGHKDTQRQDAQLAPLLDRLANRLGPGTVYRLAPLERHLPEKAQKRIHPLKDKEWQSRALHGRRPTTLFSRPERIDVMTNQEDLPIQFIWRKLWHQIVYAQGPERILPEWWENLAGRHRPRDYYEVEDQIGLRFWVYREFKQRGAAPEETLAWWLHGIYA